MLHKIGAGCWPAVVYVAMFMTHKNKKRIAYFSANFYEDVVAGDIHSR